MRSTSKTATTSILAVLLAVIISAPALTQGTTIEFRVVPTDRNPASCQQWDTALSRVHSFTPTSDGATLRTAGGITTNMTKSAPNVFAATLALGGTNFNVTADTSQSPKTLEVSEPRIGCRWNAVAP
jgi:hypothetical protein